MFEGPHMNSNIDDNLFYWIIINYYKYYYYIRLKLSVQFPDIVQVVITCVVDKT